jgi:hypothetical protein
MGIFADVRRHRAASFAEVFVLMLVMRSPVRAQIVLLGLSSKRYAAMTGSASIKSLLQVMMLWIRFAVVTAVIVYAGSNLSK